MTESSICILEILFKKLYPFSIVSNSKIMFRDIFVKKKIEILNSSKIHRTISI